MTDYAKMKNEFCNYYADLLEIQYHDKAKAIATVKANIEILLAQMLMWKIEKECLNVDVSVGVQLDTVGRWVGLDRNLQEQKFENQRWYAYYDWNESEQPNNLQGSLQDWNNETSENAPFLEYNLIFNTQKKLNDDDFRFLIKLKIIKNNTNATCKNIDDEIYNLLKDTVYTTWNDLELTYNYKDSVSGIMKIAKEKNCLVCPTGVKLILKKVTNG